MTGRGSIEGTSALLLYSLHLVLIYRLYFVVCSANRMVGQSRYIEGRGREREEERGGGTTTPQDIRGWAPLAPEGTQVWGREEIDASISSLSSFFSCDIAVTIVT